MNLDAMGLVNLAIVNLVVGGLENLATVDLALCIWPYTIGHVHLVAVGLATVNLVDVNLTVDIVDQIGGDLVDLATLDLTTMDQANVSLVGLINIIHKPQAQASGS